jgi:hypothetical protein
MIYPIRFLFGLTNFHSAEARTIMSAEHKALGYRPPPGSLAAEAQAAAAKHPNPTEHLDPNVLKEAARADAARVHDAREVGGSQSSTITGTDTASTSAGTSTTPIDLSKVGASDAATIESAEHKALGYRPPPGSLAAEAQAAAAKHPEASLGVSEAQLAEMAREDAMKVEKQRASRSSDNAGNEGNGTGNANANAGVNEVTLDLSSLNTHDAATIQSAEQKALGYRPPQGSLAAVAQFSAAQHPDASGVTLSDSQLKEAAVQDAAEVELERRGGVVVESTKAVDADVGESK